MLNRQIVNKLIKTKKELYLQNKVNEKCLAELNIANRELDFQNKEKEKLAAEFIIANKELLFQNSEKEKRAEELIIANKELLHQNREKEHRAEELVIANKELDFQNKEKEKRAAELTFANQELEKAEQSHREYILSLKEMMYMTSHQLRQPIAHILGLSEVLDAKKYTGEELVEIIGFIKQSAKCLDKFTMELTAFIYELEIKAKSKKPGEIVLS